LSNQNKKFRLPPVKVESTSINVKEIPWGVTMVNAPAMWDTTKGNGVIVAVVDTGIATKHPDLQGRVIAGKNFTSDYNGDPSNFEDNQSHGTHVAGTICAVSNNMGVVGVAPDVKLLIAKVLDGQGSGYYDSIVNGIRWAVDWRGTKGERARVISMSLGGPEDYQPLHDAIKYAVANNVAVVVAAGNEGDGSTKTDEFSYPGSYDEVIEVGAIDKNKKLASFSNTNDELDVVAPGVNIQSTVPTGWAVMSGTSMATPHTSAVVAMLIALNETPEKQLTEPEIYQLLIKNAVKINTDVKGFGNGLAYLQKPTVVPAPAPTPSPTTPPAPPTTPSKHSVSVLPEPNKYYIKINGFSTKQEALIMADKLTKEIG